jgi:hypothetical protein
MNRVTKINVASMVVMLVAVTNLIIFREVWVLAAAVAALAGLSFLSIRERRKIQKQRTDQKS